MGIANDTAGNDCSICAGDHYTAACPLAEGYAIGKARGYEQGQEEARKAGYEQGMQAGARAVLMQSEGSPLPLLRAAGAASETQAHVDLGNFIIHCRSQGLRGYKGEFVASDGTRVPCEFYFERQRPATERDDDR